MVIIEKGFLCVPIITRGKGGGGAFSHGAIVCHYCPRGRCAFRKVQYSQSNCNIILNTTMFRKNMCGFEYNYKESKLVTC